MKKLLLILTILITGQALAANTNLDCVDIISNEGYKFLKSDGQYYGLIYKKSFPENKLKLILEDIYSDKVGTEYKLEAIFERLPAQVGADYWAQKVKQVLFVEMNNPKSLTFELYDNNDQEPSLGNILLDCKK